ncbi:hypothetical protein LG3211_4031 [Lysobacter gummosus]|nr:hypothetical protein LG3211_4031 [Lysobacter gummosus]
MSVVSSFPSAPCSDFAAAPLSVPGFLRRAESAGGAMDGGRGW